MIRNVSPVDWVGRLIDQRFPLFEWLGSGESGELFRTELPGSPAQKAAIRLVPAEIDGVQAQFDDWAQAEGLSHPNLLRIFESGHGRIDENEFLYVVMELPEETLAQILPSRTLTGPEVAEMLTPILDALNYLHARGLVHGHVTPANIHVVGDRVKLSADTLQQSGQLRKLEGGLRVYDAPEVAAGDLSPASDVWSVGVTLVEALTQLSPMRNAATGELGVPQFVPEPLAEIARRCLRTDPGQRASLADIEALLRLPANRTAAVPPTAPVPARPAPPAAIPVAAAPARPSPKPPQPTPLGAADREQRELAFDEIQPSRRAMRSMEDEGEGHPSTHRSLPSTPLIVGLVALLVVLIAALFIRSRSNQPALAPETPSRETPSSAPPPSAPAPKPRLAPSPKPKPAPSRPQLAAVPEPNAPGTTKGAVAEREMPKVPEKANRTIHGKVAVRVRLAVDRDGNVSDATLDSAGPSRYFANLALQAARKWRFTPARISGQPAPSTWTLRFEFRRGRTDIIPVEMNP